MAEFNPSIFQAALLEVAEATKAANLAAQLAQQTVQQQAQQFSSSRLLVQVRVHLQLQVPHLLVWTGRS